MKIAIVVGRIEHKTGIAKSALEIVKRLIKYHEVTLVGPIDPKTIRSFSKKIKYHQIGFDDYIRARTLRSSDKKERAENKKSAYAIKKHCDEVDKYLSRSSFDIIDNWGNWATVQDIATCRFCLARYEQIEQKNNPELRSLVKYDIAKKAVMEIEKRRFESTRTRTIVVNSNKVSKEIKKIYDVGGKKIYTLLNGIDTNKFSQERRRVLRSKLRKKLNISPRTKIFLFVCTNAKRKNLPLLLKTFPLPSKYRNELWVLGVDKKDFPNIPKSVRLFSKTFAPEMYYAAADIVLVPTVYDACCNVVLEAAGMGIPVIASNQAGSHELFENDKSIILHNSDISPVKYKNILMHWLKKPKELKMIGIEAACKMKERTWQKVAEELESIYKTVCSKL